MDQENTPAVLAIGLGNVPVGINMPCDALEPTPTRSAQFVSSLKPVPHYLHPACHGISVDPAAVVSVVKNSSPGIAGRVRLPEHVATASSRPPRKQRVRQAHNDGRIARWIADSVP